MEQIPSNNPAPEGQVNEPVSSQTPAPEQPISRPPVTPVTTVKKPVSILLVTLLSLGGISALYTGVAYLMAKIINTGASMENAIKFTHMLFGLFAFTAMVMTLIGIFRMNMSKPEDPTRKKGLIMGLWSGFVFVLIIVLWVTSFITLNAKMNEIRLTESKPAVVTDPVDTFNLTAPVTISFDATNAVRDTNVQVIAYDWDFGDGEKGNGVKISHQYKNKGKNDGKFEVILKTNELNKNTFGTKVSEYKIPITIANEKTSAEFTVDKEIGEAPFIVQFDASTSADPDGEITAYEWDMDNDKQFDDATGVKTSYTFDKEGTYLITLRVTDNSGDYATFEKSIQVSAGNAPKAIVTSDVSGDTYFLSKPYNFTAEKSTSPTGKIVKYEWTFGDGTPKEKTRSVSHTFSKEGTFELNLKVTDDTGAIGETFMKIKAGLAPQAPKAVIETEPAKTKSVDTSLEGVVPFEVTFNGSKSTDPDNNIVDYKWDFNGDDTMDASGVISKYTFTQEGTYLVTLHVIDADGNDSPQSLTVKVKGQGITAKVTATPITGVVPLSVSFDASGSSYAGKQIVSYEWDFGDGSAKKLLGAQVSYKYAQIGVYEAKVTAIGADNARNTAKILITVQAQPLKACIQPSRQSGPSPVTVIFTSCSTGTISKFSWDINGDGIFGEAVGPQVQSTFVEKGDHTVSLEVSDEQGVLDKATIIITVE